MATVPDRSRARTLTHLLRRINQGDDPDVLRREALRLLPIVEPDDIASAEQSLINDGYSVQLVQLLSAMFMLMAMPEADADNRAAALPPNHLLRAVMLEHEVIRYFVAELNEVVERTEQLQCLSDLSSEFRRLAHAVEHLSAMKRHIDREDDVIFPSLKKYGRISLCRAMKGDHANIRTEIDNLGSLLVLFNEVRFDQFKAGVAAATGRLRTIIHEHLSQEDEILYPIAIGMITNSNVWEKMKALCDELGYCGVHL